MLADGRVITSDDSMVTGDGTVGVNTASSDVEITLPDGSGWDDNYLWKVVKMTEDNVLRIKCEVPGQAFGVFDSIALEHKGEYIYVHFQGIVSGGPKYWFEYGYIADEYQAPIVTTLKPDLTGTTLTMFGFLDSLKNSGSINVYFKYRQQGTTTWTETAPQLKTTEGSFTDTATVASGVVYEVQAIAKTLSDIVAVGTILDTQRDYYSGVSEAETDELIRYWPMQESSGTDVVATETIASDDMTMYNGVTIDSDVIGGQTIYKRIFGTSDYGQAAFRYSKTEDYTFLVQLKANLSSGDHTFFSTGRNRISVAGDNTSVQLEVDGNIVNWTSALPFTSILNLFIIMNQTRRMVCLYVVTGSSIINQITNSALPSRKGRWLRIGRGASGDSNHQDNEYLDDGEVRSVAIWNRVLTESEMQGVCSALESGGLIVS